MNRNHPGKSFARESGQVVVAGVFILIILLLLIFSGFDIYNTIRAKFKVETAQESAALAGAAWQRDSLNLIGEINLIKACSVLLMDDEKWNLPLPDAESNPELDTAALAAARSNTLQSRIDVLTEMQTRISFVGPLIGFAAAQQAAKANGITSIGDLEHYLEELRTSSRYSPEFGGAAEYINNYRWKAPYIDLIQTISRNGIAVYPNAINGSNPVVEPPELAYQSFYDVILAMDAAIQAANYGPVTKHVQQLSILANLCCDNRWDARFNNPPWWDIDYSTNAFPNESEIFTLGVSTSNTHSIFNEENRPKVMNAASGHLLPEHLQLIYDTVNGPNPPSGVSLKFFSYDNTWYPSYFQSRYQDYESDHYNYWFTGDVLRRHVKKQYRFEGPAAYVETAVDVGKVTSIIDFTGQRNDYRNTIRVGSNRDGGNISDLSEYRPGTIAKTLGQLNEDEPPIALPVVLPVFDKVVLMPTYMPIPYNFYVLRPHDMVLRRFLAWLSKQNDLKNSDNTLPAGCENYLLALQRLSLGPQFRYYLWNPGHDEKAFDETWRNDLKAWHDGMVKEPEKYIYSYNQGSTLPGYFQEPGRFTPCINTRIRTGITAHKDQINGGIAYRHYTSSTSYMVVNSKGHIITRREADPTLDPDCCGSCCTRPGGGTGGLSHMGSGFSTKKGPVRL